MNERPPDHKRTTYLGFDYGLQRIGVAVGEAQPPSGFPLTTLRALRGQPDWRGIAKIIATWQPSALVVGVPVHMDGVEHALTRAARRFVQQLRGRFHLPVHEADERLSSRAAREVHAAQRRIGKRKKSVDDEDRIAAALILTNWLLLDRDD